MIWKILTFAVVTLAALAVLRVVGARAGRGGGGRLGAARAPKRAEMLRPCRLCGEYVAEGTLCECERNPTP